MPRTQQALPELVIRAAVAADLAAVERLVLEVAGEVYGHLFQGAPPRPEGNWAQALVALMAGQLVGVVVADDDWIEDLWVANGSRGRGVGSRLLAAGEDRIRAKGYKLGHLRVVAENAGARRFYRAHGWSETTAYPHERWGFEMLDLIKPLTPRPG